MLKIWVGTYGVPKICQAMRVAQEQGRELTHEELREAFKKAKEAGAITGGGA